MEIVNKIGYCPVCGRSLMGKYGISPSFDDDNMYFDWGCDCGCIGKEWYSIEFLDQSDVYYIEGDYDVDVFDDDDLNKVRKEIAIVERKEKLDKLSGVIAD